MRVVKTRGLDNLATVLNHLNLALHLVLDRLLQEAERIEILDFTARAEFFLTSGTNGHIGVAAEVAFLHIAVGDAEPDDERMKRLGVADGFRSRAQLGFGHDFKKRSAGSIKVDTRVTSYDAVYRLARIFLQVRARQVNGLDIGFTVLGFDGERQLAAHNDGQLELTDLIALRQIGIKIVLAVEYRVTGDFCLDRKAELDRLLNGPFVEYRKCPRERKVDIARVAIGLITEMAGRAGENFRMGRELNMRLEANNDFPLHVDFLLTERPINSQPGGADANQSHAATPRPSRRVGLP